METVNQGGPCSNTAPTNPKRKPTKPRCISAQVDTHYGSIRKEELPYEVRQYLLDCLGSNNDEPVETVFEIDDQPLVVSWLSHGKLKLHNDCFDWREVGHGETTATVAIYSAPLWKHGPHAANDLLQAFANDLYRRPVVLYRGRIDLAKDYVGFSMRQFNVKPSRLRDLFITRARVQAIAGKDGEVETVYVAKGNKEKHLRIYNKTRDLAVHPHTHYQPAWEAADYDPGREGEVTRVEFQTNTAFWAKFVPNDALPAVTMRDQLALIGHVWDKMTQEIRMVVPDAAETHRERLATTLLWQLVQTPFDPTQPHATGSMYRRRRPQRDKLVEQTAGCVISVLAQTAGAEFATAEEAWTALGGEVLRLWSRKGELESLVVNRRARLMAG